MSDFNRRCCYWFSCSYPQQATSGDQPSMSLEMIAEGLKVVAQTVIDNEYDIHLTGGIIC